MSRISLLLACILLLPACFSNPYCKRWGERECDRGCSRECLAWSDGSNWFERHVLGTAVALALNVGMIGGGVWLNSLYAKRQKKLDDLDRELEMELEKERNARLCALEKERDELRKRVVSLEGDKKNDMGVG